MSNYVRAYLALMFALPMLSMFDSWYEKHATRIPLWHVGSDKWFDFGYMEVDGEFGREWRHFFHLKLPAYDWIQLDYNRKWGWGQYVIWWSSRRGIHLACWGAN